MKIKPVLFTLMVMTGLVATICSCTQQPDKKKTPDTDWPAYGGNKAGNRYSDLQQINATNVNKLEIAWTYQANDIDTSSAAKNKHVRETQCQPIVVNGVLYGTNATTKLFAVEAATGKQLWKFDPFKDTVPRYNSARGVAYWENGNDKRILYTAGYYLYAINAVNGEKVNSFGTNGRVDLHEGLSTGYDASKLFITATSPGIVYKNTVVMVFIKTPW